MALVPLRALRSRWQALPLLALLGLAACSRASEPASSGPVASLPIDGSHWIASESNAYGIHGAWYCYTDDIADTDCDKKPRYDKAMEALGYCISGTTIRDPDLKAWGAAVGFELQGEPGGSPASYDAAAHGIRGFAFTVSGITSGRALRVSYTQATRSKEAVPFVEFGPLDNQTRTLNAIIGNGVVPRGVELSVVGGREESPYLVCITRVEPMLAR